MHQIDLYMQASTTIFNPIQQQLLLMFSYDKEVKHLEEVKEVLTKHFATRLENKLNELWDNGTLNQERLDEINSMDLHKDLK